MAVVTFGNRAGTLRTSIDLNGGCYSNEFSYASDYNQKALTSFVNSIDAKGLGFNK